MSQPATIYVYLVSIRLPRLPQKPLSEVDDQQQRLEAELRARANRNLSYAEAGWTEQGGGWHRSGFDSDPSGAEEEVQFKVRVCGSTCELDEEETGGDTRYRRAVMRVEEVLGKTLEFRLNAANYPVVFAGGERVAGQKAVPAGSRLNRRLTPTGEDLVAQVLAEDSTGGGAGMEFDSSRGLIAPALTYSPVGSECSSPHNSEAALILAHEKCVALAEAVASARLRLSSFRVCVQDPKTWAEETVAALAKVADLLLEAEPALTAVRQRFIWMAGGGCEHGGVARTCYHELVIRIARTLLHVFRRVLDLDWPIPWNSGTAEALARGAENVEELGADPSDLLGGVSFELQTIRPRLEREFTRAHQFMNGTGSGWGSGGGARLFYTGTQDHSGPNKTASADAATPTPAAEGPPPSPDGVSQFGSGSGGPGAAQFRTSGEQGSREIPHQRKGLERAADSGEAPEAAAEHAPAPEPAPAADAPATNTVVESAPHELRVDGERLLSGKAAATFYEIVKTPAKSGPYVVVLYCETVCYLRKRLHKTGNPTAKALADAIPIGSSAGRLKTRYTFTCPAEINLRVTGVA